MRGGHVFNNTFICRAELISEGSTYAGLIKDISRRSIYFLTAEEVPETDCYIGAYCEVTFAPLQGKLLKVEGKVTWSYRTSPSGSTSIIAEVTGHPPGYLNFLKTL